MFRAAFYCTAAKRIHWSLFVCACVWLCFTPPFLSQILQLVITILNKELCLRNITSAWCE